MESAKEKIQNVLERNVVEIVEKTHLESELQGGKKLRIKLGIDPTGPKLHLGRAIALWKLREFQELGHQIVLIIGDFTGLVGDASDKTSGRPMLSKEQIKRNMKDYKTQIGKILDLNKTEFRNNSEWLAKIKFEELIKLASLFTVHQLVNRRNFKERFESGSIVGFHEFFYPLMQGYDSVAICADVELGGTDQLFNLMAGRKIQEFYGQKSQDIMTLEMLEGLDGKKMSTTYGNIINITDEPADMFGKVMSMKDGMIVKYFQLATRLTLAEIQKIDGDLINGKVNPLEVKKDLAFEIVKLYHGNETARKAKDDFVEIFQKKELPQNAIQLKAKKGDELSDVLLNSKFVSSKAVFRRLIKERAIDFEGTTLEDVHWQVEKGGIVRIGKKKFVKIIIQ